ncbi:MAG: glycosyl transferase family 1, partial [Nanohaloarchaea archaeon SW_4_43_9]
MKQKILLVGWGYPPEIDGGLDIHIKHLFEELRKSGIDVDLVLPEERAPDREEVIPIDTGDGDMVQRSRKMSSRIAELAENYDIVHTHDWFGAESGFKAKKYGNVNWISTFHSLSSGRNREPGGDLQKLEKVAA